jgi:sortase A
VKTYSDPRRKVHSVDVALFVDARVAGKALPARAAKLEHRTQRPRLSAVKRAALFCLATGGLLLAFVAYQLWGTALYEHHAQGVLLHELKAHGIVSTGQHHANSAGDSSAAPRGSSTSSGYLVDRFAPTIPPPATGQPIGLISIPAIGLSNDAIVQGTGDAQLEEGPGHYSGTPLPGELGNAAIAGHRTTYAAPFYNLDELQPGNFIYILTSQGSFVYKVTRSQIVTPDDVAVLDSQTFFPELTLTTCNPRYSATQRLVVTAFLSSSIIPSGTAASPVSSSKPRAQDRTSSRQTAPSGPATLDEVGQALLWGSLAFALAFATVFAWRRMWGLKAAVVVVLGAPAVVTVLLVCFQHVSLALPETF